MSEGIARAVPHKLITAVLPIETDVLGLIRELKKRDITSANLNYGRGMGRFTRATERRLGDVSQKEILSVLVPAERADEIFEFIFDAADINRPHGGLVFMQSMLRTTDYVLPDVLDEEA